MSQQFKIHRVTALPAQLEAYAVYLVASATNTNYVEMYVSNSTGSDARRVINEADIDALIDSKLSTINEITIVDDITARGSVDTSKVIYVYVKDATADSTVASGGASYLYDKSTYTWVKVNEYESMDLVSDWSKIENKPTSTVQAIDAAVADSHTHSNKTQLDKVGEDVLGNFTYNGAAVNTQWTTTDW